MIRSDQLDALNAALSAAQGEFEAVDKSASNPFFRSSYAPLPEVVKAASPILAKHGLAVWQGGDTDESGELLWTVVLHSSGQFVGSAARLLPVKNDPQAQGSAVTYQRRYQYMSALGLVADTDDDGEAASGRTRSKPPSRKETRTRPNPRTTPEDGHSEAHDGSQTPLATEDTLQELRRVYKAAKVTESEYRKILTEAGVPDGKGTADLTEDQATWVVIKLSQKAAG